MSLFAHAHQHNYFEPLPLQVKFWIIFHLCYVNHPLGYCQQYSNNSGIFLPVMARINRFFMSSSKISHLKLWYGFCKDTINLHLQLFFLYFSFCLCTTTGLSLKSRLCHQVVHQFQQYHHHCWSSLSYISSIFELHLGNTIWLMASREYLTFWASECPIICMFIKTEHKKC